MALLLLVVAVVAHVAVAVIQRSLDFAEIVGPAMPSNVTSCKHMIRSACRARSLAKGFMPQLCVDRIVERCRFRAQYHASFGLVIAESRFRQALIQFVNDVGKDPKHAIGRVRRR